MADQIAYDKYFKEDDPVSYFRDHDVLGWRWVVALGICVVIFGLLACILRPHVVARNIFGGIARLAGRVWVSFKRLPAYGWAALRR